MPLSFLLADHYWPRDLNARSSLRHLCVTPDCCVGCPQQVRCHVHVFPSAGTSLLADPGPDP
eukprot:11436075-Heterocapsa_arctica.AAC.2